MFTTQTILKHNNTPVIILRKYKIDCNNLKIELVKAELKRHLLGEGDHSSSTWGYFPELRPEKSEYSESIRLLQILQNNLFPDINVKPAFVRLATAEPISEFGGLHIDVSPGVSHKKLHRQGDILRILLNIGEYSRCLEYLPFDLPQLHEKYGLDISDNEYNIIHLPKGLKVSRLIIPPVEPDVIHVLAFRSNRIVHAGSTNNNGHFLASFGGVLPISHITKFFEQ